MSRYFKDKHFIGMIFENFRFTKSWMYHQKIKFIWS